jgi:hypothetical protein
MSDRIEQRGRLRVVAAASAGAVAFGAASFIAAVLVGAGQADRDALPAAPVASQEPSPITEAALLLDAPTVERVRGGTWTEQPAEASHSPFVTGCDEAPPGPQPSSGAVRALDGPEGTVVRSQVLAYRDDMGASMGWKTVWLDIERCPEQREQLAGGQEATTQVSLVHTLPESMSQRGYGTSRSRECADCAWRTEHFSFSQVGPHLVLVRLAGGELESLPALSEAAEQRVRCGGDCAPPVPSQAAPRPWVLAEAFLSPAAAAAAEGPPMNEARWSVVEPYAPDQAPLADPCSEGSVPLAGEVVDSGERAMSSTREAGGSSLTQEVYRYSSSFVAYDAHLHYVDRFRRCSDVPDPNGFEGSTIRSELIGPGDAPSGDRLLVRRLPCQEDTCTDHFATYVMVVREADALTVVGYAIAEDGDPLEQAGRIVGAVHEHLRRVAGT